MGAPLVSIVVPFISWNDYVRQCVENCLKMDYRNFELILVPDTGIKIPFKDRRIKTVVSGKKNISQKRNMGIRRARSDTNYFAFIDSDAYPRKDWLKNALKYFRSDNGYAAIGGPNVTPPDDTLRQKCAGNVLKSFFCGGPRSFQVNEKGRSRLCTDLPTCNLVVRRCAIEHANYFDEKLETGEDLKLCYTITKNGGKIFFARDVVVYHHRRSLFVPFLRQRYVYGRSVPTLIRKEGSRSNSYLLGPAVLLTFIVIGAVISVLIPVLGLPYLVLIAIFIVAALEESIRFSKSAKEVPLTFTGFVLGVLAPGLGTFVSLFRPSYSVRYSNYKKRLRNSGSQFSTAAYFSAV